MSMSDGKCLSSDFRAFTRLSCVYVQTFVRSCPDFRALTRFSCVHQIFVHSCPDFRAFTKISCFRVQTFKRPCPEFRAFMFRFWAFFDVSGQCNFEHTTPSRAFTFALDTLASVWDPYLHKLMKHIYNLRRIMRSHGSREKWEISWSTELNVQQDFLIYANRSKHRSVFYFIYSFDFCWV